MTGKSPYLLIGCCIYCGATGSEVELTDEHIVPKALDGKAQLLKASCISCAKITAAIEGYVCSGMLGEVRNAMGTYTRRPKERPDTLPMKYRSGDQINQIELPVEKHPTPFLLPHLPFPGILDASVSQSTWATVPYGIWSNQLDVPELARGKLTILMKQHVDFDRFGRVVAKIAHCDAVNYLGIGGFEAFLPNVVRGVDSRTHRFVGAIPGKHLPHPSGFFRKMSLLERDGQLLMIHFLRLFGDVGMWRDHLTGPPIYISVVGKVGATCPMINSFGPIAQDVVQLCEDAKDSMFAIFRSGFQPMTW